jgi:hypothetical protein
VNDGKMNSADKGETIQVLVVAFAFAAVLITALVVMVIHATNEDRLDAKKYEACIVHHPASECGK